MKTTLEAVIVPVGEKPYPKTLEADENGSFLRALQECVGGRIEPLGYLFGDAPTVYCNEEGTALEAGAARTAQSTRPKRWQTLVTRAPTTRAAP